MIAADSLSIRHEARLSRLPKPSGFAAPAKRQRIVFAVVSTLLIAFAIFEWIAYPVSDSASLVHAVIYIIVLAIFALQPYPAACLMMFVSIASTMAVHIYDGPTDYLGTWYAIITACTLHVSALPAICFATMSGVLFAILNFVGGSLNISGAVSMALFDFLALAIGLYARLNRSMHKRTLEYRLAQQQLSHERDNAFLMHQLHDSIAGDIAYAIMLLQSDDEPRREQAVKVLRLALGNVRSLVRHTPINNTINEVTSNPGNADKLQNLVMDRANRLMALGFKGTPVVNCSMVPSETLYETLRFVIVELTNNIIKHARPGEYAFVVDCGSECVMVATSNLTMERQTHDTQSQHKGLSLMNDAAHSLGGTLTINQENDEWTACFSFPTANCL